MSLLAMPSELLLQIAASLDAKDLNSLLRTNIRLTHLLTSLLYSFTEQDDYAVEAFKCAARNKIDKMVKFILSKGANLEARDRGGRTALMWAATVGNEAAALVLLDNGASKHEALHAAIRCGQPRMVKFLLERGIVNVNHWLMGWGTPLHVAAMYGRLQSAVILLDHGADPCALLEMPNSTDLGIPTQFAAYFGHDEVAKLLSEAKDKGNAQPVFLGAMQL